MNKNMSVVNIETINEDNRKKIEEQTFEEAVVTLTEKLELANSMLKTILETTHDFLVFGLDREYRYLSFNNRHKAMAKEIWGADIEIGTRILDIIKNYEERDNLKTFFDRVLAGEQFSSIEEYQTADGSVVVGKNHWAPIRKRSGEIIGIVCFIEDVTANRNSIKNLLTEKNSLDQNMESLSFYDQLTGVYNRRFYDKELAHMDESQQYPLSIIFMNINGMSKINYEYGHAVGDILMRKAVQVLKYGVRGDDVVARYEGDEFVILMPRTEGAKVERALERFKKSMSEIKVQSIKVSVAFGFATKYDETEKTDDVVAAAQKQLIKQIEIASI